MAPLTSLARSTGSTYSFSTSTRTRPSCSTAAYGVSPWAGRAPPESVVAHAPPANAHPERRSRRVSGEKRRAKAMAQATAPRVLTPGGFGLEHRTASPGTSRIPLGKAPPACREFAQLAPRRKAADNRGAHVKAIEAPPRTFRASPPKEVPLGDQ